MKISMKKKRYIFSLIFTVLMVFIAEYSGELEVIFPEILALLAGAWISEFQPWKVSRKQLFLLMSLSSFVGVMIVRYASVHIIIKIAMAFTFCFLILTITKTTIIPLISACILPILLNTTTWIYPISVTVMCALIVIFQYYMEVFNIRTKEEVFNENINSYSASDLDISNHKIKSFLSKYLKTLACILLVALFPVLTNNLYFIAPPLIVTFIEFSDIKSPARINSKKIIILLGITSLIGASSRIILNTYLHLPLWLVASLITTCVFIIFEKMDIIFPPAGAVSLLPLLLNFDKLYLYPIEILIGSFVFINLALFIFKEEKIPYPISND